MYTLAEENYLKTIFHLEQEFNKEVSTNALAETMQTKASSATDMVQKLADKGLVSYRKYRGARLSKEGEKAAIYIVRKHRLWEVFLVEKLNFQWDEVHHIAEQLEHVNSAELINRLDKFLDYPDYDPHGDPIPDKNGNIKSAIKKLLSELKKGNTGQLVGVRETSAEFLQFLDKRNIAIGASIKVLGREFFDGSMVIQVKKEQFFISKKIADNLYIQI
ncbi:DtxR family iron (metal) dependent repressor [Dokdonia sp. Hel_I_63]|uniref:metal-dependent transcriptional regulator n=1 Tax=Dokdonia sp. Hel_I_63 TaxID=1249996 RepID=UPI00119BD5AB|nr:metal-dependent transcriptional regulator [Dokdonia sp. Hel_I_63]TVZ21392.1 DtxR family iron (metal) dependent repressor [Dokdonia sp. Hel_I_63]